MRDERWFNPTDRYEFDFGVCSSSRGFAQFDTREDASYYGIWVNPFSLAIFSYTEGDCCLVQTDTKEEFVKEIDRMVELLEFRGIDPGFNPALKKELIELGLKKYLHRGTR